MDIINDTIEEQDDDNYFTKYILGGGNGVLSNNIKAWDDNPLHSYIGGNIANNNLLGLNGYRNPILDAGSKVVNTGMLNVWGTNDYFESNIGHFSGNSYKSPFQLYSEIPSVMETIISPTATIGRDLGLNGLYNNYKVTTEPQNLYMKMLTGSNYLNPTMETILFPRATVRTSIGFAHTNDSLTVSIGPKNDCMDLFLGNVHNDAFYNATERNYGNHKLMSEVCPWLDTKNGYSCYTGMGALGNSVISGSDLVLKSTESAFSVNNALNTLGLYTSPSSIYYTGHLSQVGQAEGLIRADGKPDWLTTYGLGLNNPIIGLNGLTWKAGFEVSNKYSALTLKESLREIDGIRIEGVNSTYTKYAESYKKSGVKESVTFEHSFEKKGNVYNCVFVININGDITGGINQIGYNIKQLLSTTHDDN